MMVGSWVHQSPPSPRVLDLSPAFQFPSFGLSTTLLGFLNVFLVVDEALELEEEEAFSAALDLVAWDGVR